MNADNAKTAMFTIVVKRFYDVLHYKQNPPQGTKVYSEPSGSTVVYTFPAAITSPDYSIDALVFSGSNYWVRFINLGSSKVKGYVNCSSITFDVKPYAAPDKQTPDSTIGSNPSVTFNMWYYPVSGYTGVNYPTPLYYQYYYMVGGSEPINSEKCTLLSSVSGDYMYEGKDYHPNNFLIKMTSEYWDDKYGMKKWIAKMSLADSQDSILKKAKSNLDLHKPFLVGGQNEDGIPHLVLVTGYKNSGSNLSDYIVLDSSQKYFSNLDSFFESFSDPTKNWIVSGKGYVYGEY